MIAECCHCILYQSCLLLVILIINVKWLQGLQCLSCTDAVLPTECETVKQCGPYENCFTEKYVSDSGIIRFHLGCKVNQQCPPQNATQHKIRNSLTLDNISNASKVSYSAANSSEFKHDKVYADYRRSQGSLVCSECCTFTICNSAGCGHAGYRSPRGPVCFHCPQQRTPGDCDKITVCGINQMCMLTSIVSSVTHDMLYQTKCEEEVACSVNAIALIGKRRKRRFTAICCKEELCNLDRNSTSSPSVSPLTSPVPVTVNYPCISNPCARGRCSPDNGTYHCICENGFSGRHCDQFIAETSTSTSVNTVALERCLPNPCVWGKCESIQTTYICICDHGYYGTKCDKDINECDVTTACGVEATCTNFQGGYNCTCHTGFPQGDPKIHCYKPVLVEIETPGSWYQMNDELLPAANIPYKMPYLNKEFNAYRPSMNGYFVLDAQPLYENYGPQNPHDWQKFSYSKTVIAPLWTDLDATGGQGGLNFNLLEKYTNYGLNNSVYRDLTMLGVLFSTSLNLSDFDPRVAIVATWRNITRWTTLGPKENIKRENISMQAILISDGIQTYLMFNYDQEQWSLKPLSYAPAAAGYSNQDKTDNIIADNHNFTTLNNRSNVGIAGRYIYNVSFDDYNRVSQLINDTKCLKFRQNRTIEKWIKNYQALSDPCPCNENQMQLEYTYRVVPALYDHPHVPLTCYEAWFFNNDYIWHIK